MKQGAPHINVLRYCGQSSVVVYVEDAATGSDLEA